jgi:hypothetical protein
MRRTFVQTSRKMASPGRGRLRGLKRLHVIQQYQNMECQGMEVRGWTAAWCAAHWVKHIEFIL